MMFSWFRKKRQQSEPSPSPAPPPAPAPAPAGQPYPRMGTKIKLALKNAQRSWEEHADLVQLLSNMLESNGHAIAPHDDGVLHKASGIVFHPDLCDLQLCEPSGMRTATIVEARHPAFHQ